MLNNYSFIRFLICLSLAVIISGCVPSNAPKGWLESVEMKTESGFGGWIKVWNDTGSEKLLIAEGELLAISTDSLFLFDNSQLISIPKSGIKKLKLEIYKSDSDKVSSWALGGTVTSVFHGVLAIGTIPLWILTGVAASTSAANDPVETMSRSEIQKQNDIFWNKIRKGARFPAGFPAGLNRSDLKPKSWVGGKSRNRKKEFKN